MKRERNNLIQEETMRQTMKRNVSGTDRILRFALGAGALSLVFFGPQTAWGYVGLIAVLSSLSGFCPIYALFKRGT